MPGEGGTYVGDDPTPHTGVAFNNEGLLMRLGEADAASYIQEGHTPPVQCGDAALQPTRDSEAASPVPLAVLLKIPQADLPPGDPRQPAVLLLRVMRS
ncbi:hypothetical protein NDU88_002229 [Pleurodeles waltl]|uniref:Uncharacterized protein n=1 Tax=Pleurodeles waltl TaxID=8319 RepID=A0AAV7Q994_PLEWA|nr:hypothetical protein NDU88_002229 [Pleurodeles waltl]